MSPKIKKSRNEDWERVLWKNDPYRTSEDHANNIVILRERYLNEKFYDEDGNEERIVTDVIFWRFKYQVVTYLVCVDDRNEESEVSKLCIQTSI